MVFPTDRQKLNLKVKHVCKNLQALNISKSLGLDGITAILLRKCASELAPESLESSRVQPINKKETKALP